MLHLEESLFELIRNPANGSCVFRHGAEVYHLIVKAEKHKEKMFTKKE